jgi:transposase
MIGLPSLRALDGAQGARIWLAAETTDMRCGFDRLAERVRVVIGQDPLSNSLFIFRSRRGDRLKILLWNGMDLFFGTSAWNRECSSYRV